MRGEHQNYPQNSHQVDRFHLGMNGTEYSLSSHERVPYYDRMSSTQIQIIFLFHAS